MLGSPIASHLLGALLVLFGGVGLGFALAQRKRSSLAAVFGFLAVVGVGLPFFVPRVQEIIQCRMDALLCSDEAHPQELLGAWVGWDTSHPTPYCRLELKEDGTGRCVFWYASSDGQPETRLWRVTRWKVWRSAAIELDLESGERRERMRGTAFEGALSLRYFGSDGPVTKNWFGPLHLVPEDAGEAARRDVAAALGER